MASRLRRSGKDMLLPDGTRFVRLGINGRWELFKVGDAARYQTRRFGFERIEFPFRENGSAGDAYMAGQPGNLNPAFIATLRARVQANAAVGIWSFIEMHSKCGRLGYDPADSSLGIYCASPDDTTLWPHGRNVFTDPTRRTDHFAALAELTRQMLDCDMIGAIGPLVEPAPDAPYTDTDIRTFYEQGYDVIKAVDPKVLVITGGSSYQPANLSFAILTGGRNDIVVTADVFNFSANPDPPQSAADRINQVADFRDANNVPAYINQLGARPAQDTDLSVTRRMLKTAYDRQLTSAWWEFHTPGVGGTTYGFALDPTGISPAPDGFALSSDGAYYIRVGVDELLMPMAYSFAALVTPLSTFPSMPTALDLIQGALRKIGEFAPGEVLPPYDANVGLDTLNALLDIWSNEHLAVYNNVETVFPLTGGKQFYTIGPGGDVNITRPLRITNMYTRLTSSGSGVDFQCQEVATDKYTSIGLKSQPGPWPKMAYYNTGYPLAQLYFWPVPSGGEFHLWTDMVLTNLSLASAISLPPGYYLALQYNLAVMLAPEYGTSAEILLPVAKLATSLKKVLKATNAQPQPEVPLEVASMTSSIVNDAGWILSGGF